MDILTNCHLCYHNCGANRYLGVGICGASSKIKVAHYGLHMWEEPVLSGTKGSGTVFFSYCNLKCIFCQNQKISTEGYGKEISETRLQEIFLELQEMGAHNINLVTPTHYVPQIVNSLRKIKGNTLKIPVIYNTSSYENVSTIQFLQDSIDIYLADLKYFDSSLALQYSHCPNYFEVASRAISEMVKQIGSIEICNGIMKKGVIVRVLVLPDHIDDAKKILTYLYQTYQDKIIISIMNQYTPMKNFSKYPNLNRKLTDDEYDEVVNFAYDLGIRQAFIQEGDTQLQSFIPDFDCSRI